MPRPPIDRHWEARIYELAAQGYRSPTITTHLDLEAVRTGRAGNPSEKTVLKYYRRWEGKSHADREMYAPFEWPESMAAAGLPWEASRTVLEYLRRCRENALYLYGRPSVRMVTWYWRVHQAAADASEDDWEWGASYLIDSESDLTEAGKSIARAVESYLVYAPWQWDYGSSDHEDIARTLKELFLGNGVGYDWQPGTEPVHIDRLHRFVEVVRMVRKMPRELDMDGTPLDIPDDPWLWHSKNLEAAGLYALDDRRSEE